MAVLPVAGGTDGTTVTIDLAPLGGQTPTAIRYALGSGCDGDFLSGGQGRVCCGPFVETSKQPCPPGSCPIKVRSCSLFGASQHALALALTISRAHPQASGRLGLPAVPFLAEIVGGKCRCLPPQTCDA